MKQQRYNFGGAQTIGSGSSAQVYQVFDKELGKNVAIKKLKKSKNKCLISQEIDVLQKINQSDLCYIIKYLDSFEDKDFHYIVMEYLEGYQDLHQFTQSKVEISPKFALEIFVQICMGVQILHNKQIIHRDLKPSNILICERPLNIKIIDFGVAKELQNNLQQNQTTAGTYSSRHGYISPQNIYNLGYDGQANDIWSLGVILFQIMTNEFPFTINKQFLPEKMNEEIKTKTFHLDFDIKDVVLNCLEIEENKRIKLEDLIKKVEQKLSKIYKKSNCVTGLPDINWSSLDKFRPEIDLRFIK